MRNRLLRRFVAPVGMLAALAVTALAAPPAGHKTQHIIFVMTDGLRWQEVFQGADASLMVKQNGGADRESLRNAYLRDTPAERRPALMPFFWSTIAQQGQIYGNRMLEAEAYVTNGHNFSYPGYSETLCGFADPRVDSNDKVPNPNVTVLEWLHQKPAYRGKVAAFGAWDVFPSIFNAARAGFPVNAGYDPFTAGTMTPRIEFLNQIKAEIPRGDWEGEPYDVLTFHTALEYLKADHPRVLYLSLGETDEWAHGGNYTEYLEAAHRADAYLKVLWETVQSIPEYRGNTTLIFSVDHGRGLAPTEWRDHGEKLNESKYIWMAFLGPDTPALGERARIPAVTQNQIAATLAALLGEDYNAAVPKAGKPIRDVIAPEYQGKPYGEVPVIPGTVQAAQYDLGGEGVAYHDVDTVNHGSGELNHTGNHCRPGTPDAICYFREKDGVDISYTKDFADFNHPNLADPPKNQLYVGWQEEGEWTRYTVNVKQAGAFKVVALYSNAANAMQLDIDGHHAADCKLPLDTHTPHHWNKAEIGKITFPETGAHVLTVHYGKGNNLAYLEFLPE